MDPDSNFAALLAALNDGDADTAAELAEALAGWIGRGGFKPAALVAALAEVAQ